MLRLIRQKLKMLYLLKKYTYEENWKHTVCTIHVCYKCIPVRWGSSVQKLPNTFNLKRVRTTRSYRIVYIFFSKTHIYHTNYIAKKYLQIRTFEINIFQLWIVTFLKRVKKKRWNIFNVTDWFLEARLNSMISCGWRPRLNPRSVPECLFRSVAGK